jgi:hypothetical protein
MTKAAATTTTTMRDDNNNDNGGYGGWDVHYRMRKGRQTTEQHATIK